MPYKSPFADTAAVQKITSDLHTLSVESVTIEEDVFKAKSQADDLSGKYKSDFGILAKIPAFFDQYADSLRQQNNTARDVATKIQALFDDYLLLLEAVGSITSKEDAQDVIGAFSDDIESPNPLDQTPLDGYEAVTKEFNYIWTLKSDESKHIVDTLKGASDIAQTVKDLVAELALVTPGITNVQNALKDYAGRIHT